MTAIAPDDRLRRAIATAPLGVRVPVERDPIPERAPWPPLPDAAPRERPDPFDPGGMIAGACPGLCEFVLDSAEAIQIAADVPAALCLPMSLMAAAHRVRYRIKPGYHEAPALFAVALAESGERKSQTVGAVTRPFRRWREKHAEANAEHYEEQRKARQRLIARIQGLERIAGSVGENQKMDPEQAAKESARLSRELRETDWDTHPPLLWTSDATQAALVDNLEDHRERIAIVSTEDEILQQILGLYSDKQSFSILLKGYDNDQIVESRRGRRALGESVNRVVERPNVNMALACQPEAFRPVLGSRRMKGLGLIGRCMLVLPETRRGGRDVRRSAPVDDRVAGDYARACARLMDGLFAKPGDAPPREITLSPEALERYYDLAEGLERGLEPDVGEHADYPEWASKHAGRVCRIALSLHLWRWAYGEHEFVSGQIDDPTFAAAARWSPYLISHARSVFEVADRELSNPIQLLAEQVITRTLKRGERVFTKREAHKRSQALARRCVAEGHAGRESEAVDRAVAILQESGQVRLEQPEASEGPGRKPSPRFRIHPDLVDACAATQ